MRLTHIQTDIFSPDDQLLYQVSTTQDKKTVDTTIRHAAGEVMAVLHWRDLLSDKLEGAMDEIETPQINHCKILRSLKYVTLCLRLHVFTLFTLIEGLQRLKCPERCMNG